MNFKDSLLRERQRILRGWYEVVLDRYPEEAARALKKSNDPFLNPLSHHLARTLEGLFDVVTGRRPVGEIEAQIDDLLRIRGIQDLTPAGAVSFVFDLKNVVRDILAEEIFSGDAGFVRDLLLFETEVDEAASAVFESYVRIREKLIQLRTREVKRNTYRLLQQAGVVTEITDPNADVTRMPTG